MPNSLSASYHKSNLNEYLAQCFLSALGVSSPVPRQEDIGIDFYCALSHETDRRLTFHSPYAVQCGSEEKKQFVYGGFNKKTGRWKREARDWLFEQQLPFFACTVSAREERFRLYATCSKWVVRSECGHLRMAAVELLPGAKFDPMDASIPRETIATASDCCDECDGNKYGVPLREPIVELRNEDLTNCEALQAARDVLKQAIEIEQHNITYNLNLRTAFTYWFTDIVTNGAKSLRTAHAIHFNAAPGSYVGPILDSLGKSAVVLALNFKAQKNFDAIKHLAPVFRLLPSDTFPESILNDLPQEVADSIRRV